MNGLFCKYGILTVPHHKVATYPTRPSIKPAAILSTYSSNHYSFGACTGSDE